MNANVSVPHDLGRFRVFCPIGQGGMGVVFAGIDLEAKAFVAIKTLFTDLLDDEIAVQRFGQECEISSLLNNTNVVRFFDTGQEDTVRYLALEYVRGTTLGDMLETGTRLHPAQVVEILEDCARGLEHVHEKDIIHRDLKPDNVIINQDGVLKIIDFGIGMLDYEDPFTPEGLVVGTCGYSSPEQNQGHDLGPTSDLYSLGALAWHALVGRRWAVGQNPFQVAMCQLGQPLTAPSTLVSDVPPRLDKIVLKLMDREATERYADASELLQDLAELREEEERRGGTDNLFADPIASKWAVAKRSFYEQKFPVSKSLAKYIADRRPDFAPVHFLLGKLFALEEREFNSTDSFQQAMRLDPANLEYRADFALSLYRLNMFSLAKQELETLIEKQPEHPLGSGFLKLVDQKLSTQRKEDGRDKASNEGSAPVGDDFDPEVLAPVETAQVPPQLASAPIPYAAPPQQVATLSLLFPGLGRLRLFDLTGAARVLLTAAFLVFLIYASLYLPKAPPEGWERSMRLFVNGYLKKQFALSRVGAKQLAKNLVSGITVVRLLFALLATTVTAWFWHRERKNVTQKAIHLAHQGEVLDATNSQAMRLTFDTSRGVLPGEEVEIYRIIENGRREFVLGRVKVQSVQQTGSTGAFLAAVGITQVPLAGDRLRAIAEAPSR